jgi:type I restriction-modification system DNA methylase subunit
MPLFQNTVITKHLKSQDHNLLNERWEIFKSNFHNATIQENIRNSKEEQYQGEFLIDLFVNVLGYTKNPTPNFNITTEYKNVKDSKKADGAIIINDTVKAVIELKGTNTTDLNKIEVQAFGYKNNQPECSYVITSNFEKLRFYIDNAIEHIEFNLFTLTEEEFKILYLCLAYENIEIDIPKKIKEKSLSEEDAITKELYKDYSLFRRELHKSLVELNPQYDALILFNKTQKILDRFLFLFFAEDRQLLPPNSVRLILKQWIKLKELDAYTPLFDRFKKYFGYLNTGFKGKQYDVYAYNGGLFKADEILDTITIDDDLLYKNTLTLSEYDFNSEVDVNILGHIFENSLSEIEEIQAKLDGQVIDQSKSKRKKDGVFYTPKYITKYIVENTVGKLCEEKKAELIIIEDDYSSDKKRQQKTRKALLDKLTEYRNWLLQITICDPAVGSGAFLNQALDFLIVEHKYIDELQAKLFGASIIYNDVEKSILENNLFGVDINEEAVEIAKLSLWLRTAQPNRKLNDLNNNIKCGNSLIDDPAVAGDKAFNWQKEFPEIFENGGFDVVIGNPPYVSKSFTEIEKCFFRTEYSTSQYQLDLYVSFMEKAVNIIKDNGLLSYIVPNSWLKNLMFDKCRAFVLGNLYLDIIIPNLDNVFSDASVDTLVFVGKKSDQVNSEIEIGKFKNSIYQKKHVVSQERFLNNDKLIFDVEISLESESIFKKIEEQSTPLVQVADITRGINPYDKYRGQSAETIKNKIYHSSYKKDETFVPEIRGKHVNRYSLEWDNESFVSYGDWLAAPREPKYFEGNRIICRQVLGTHLNCVFVNSKFIIDQSVFIAKFDTKQSEENDPKFILSQLTSKLISFYFRYKANEFDALFPKIKIGEYKLLPIKRENKNLQMEFVEYSNRMLTMNQSLFSLKNTFRNYLKSTCSLKNLSRKLQNWHELEFAGFIKELNKAIKVTNRQRAKDAVIDLGDPSGQMETTPYELILPLTKLDEMEWMEVFETKKAEAQTLKTQIDTTDKEIDQMVYELYGLTDDEISIVENS